MKQIIHALFINLENSDIQETIVELLILIENYIVMIVLRLKLQISTDETKDII